VKTKESPAEQLAGFIAKFDPAMQKRIRSARAALRKRLPTATELIYDNYNFLVMGFSPTERPSDAICSLGANAKGINLFFLWGATLPDPHKLLEGQGNQVRFVRLESTAMLAKPEIEAFFRAAIAQSRAPFQNSGRGPTIIKLISAKQRPRR
jgi:hypothetical protein